MPRVSVVTPAHDAAAFIADTLRSVAEQTFSDWEMVVADDASSDGTAELVEGFGDPRIRLVRSAENLGPAGARNLALEHATGELVAFLDADDRWLPEYLERQISRYDAARVAGIDVGIVASDAYYEGPEGRLPGTHATRQGRADGAGVTELLAGNPVFISALVPRAIVDAVGGFSTECWGSEDHDLWLRIAERGHAIVGGDEPLVLYRVAEGSVSSSKLRMARTDAATFRRALARGNLDGPQRRIARSRLWRARAAEAVERARQLAVVMRRATGRARRGG